MEICGESASCVVSQFLLNKMTANGDDYASLAKKLGRTESAVKRKFAGNLKFTAQDIGEFLSVYGETLELPTSHEDTTVWAEIGISTGRFMRGEF